MEIILIAVLVVGVIAFIAYPLFTTPRAEISDAPSALESLIAQRDSTYDALRDLDFDFQMGKLSQADYTALREKSKTRAAQILKAIDALNGGGRHPQADAEIEAQVTQLRRAKTDNVEAEIARVRAAKKLDGARCAKCGAPYQVGDQFCAKCGNKL